MRDQQGLRHRQLNGLKHGGKMQHQHHRHYYYYSRQQLYSTCHDDLVDLLGPRVN